MRTLSVSAMLDGRDVDRRDFREVARICGVGQRDPRASKLTSLQCQTILELHAKLILIEAIQVLSAERVILINHSTTKGRMSLLLVYCMVLDTLLDKLLDAIHRLASHRKNGIIPLRDQTPSNNPTFGNLTPRISPASVEFERFRCGGSLMLAGKACCRRCFCCHGRPHARAITSQPRDIHCTPPSAAQSSLHNPPRSHRP